MAAAPRAVFSCPPLTLAEFPLAVSPLARRSEADPAFCDRFELISQRLVGEKHLPCVRAN